jgi:glycosyltransferase involved in cell wall biosynthesis
MISVIVATYNRSPALRALLASCEGLVAPDGGWELIVVDNGSSDRTAAFLKEARQRGAPPLVSLQERRAGKPAALNTGLQHARGDIIAFTDDDCILPSNWLTALKHEFEADPALGGIGGRIELHDSTDRQITTLTSSSRRRLTSPSQLFGFIFGCNMAFRRSVIDAVDGFDPLVGPGAPIGSGNDVDLVYRAFRQGHPIEYSPDVVVYHAHGRRTDTDVDDLMSRYLIGHGGFYCKYALQGDWSIIAMAGRELVRTAFDLLKNLRPGGEPRGPWRALGSIYRGAAVRLRLWWSGEIPLPVRD